MKQLRVTVFLLFLFTLITSAVFGQEGIKFRGAEWGASMDEIKAQEDATIVETSNTNGLQIIGYEEALFGEEVLAYYVFAEDQLVRGGYIFTDLPNDGMELVSLYDDIHEALTGKYGEADGEREYWKEDTYKPNLSKGFQYGDVIKYHRWQSLYAEVYLAATGANYNTQIKIEYDSLTLDDLEKRVVQEEAEGKL